MIREFIFAEAQATVPLVKQILNAISAAQSELDQARKRLEIFTDCRLSKRYEIRNRYYQALELVRVAEQRLADAEGELADLGVELIDSHHGVAGFNFTWSPRAGSENTRKATFLLKLNDPQPSISHWRFIDEDVEHRIPSHWMEDVPRVSRAKA